MSKSKVPFISFLTAEGLALLSQAAFMLVLPWLILTVTKSVAYTSTISTIATLPTIAASLLAGHIIDRVGRRRFSGLAILGCAVAAAGLAFTATIGVINIAWLIVFGLVANSFLIPSMTARDTLMKDIATASGVALEQIAGTRQIIFGITFLVGPAIAGLLLGHMSPEVVLWLIAVCWTIAAICTRFLPRGPKIDTKEATTLEGSVWRRMLRSPVIVLAMFIALGTCLITSPVTDVLIPAHFRGLNQPQLLGAALAILAVGSLVGSGLYMGLVKFARATYIGAVLLVTAGFAILAALPSFWPLAGGLFLIGFGSGLATPFLMVVITNHTKDSERGRVMSIYNTLSLGATPVGLALLSLLLLHASVKTAFAFVLVIWLIVAVVMLAGGKKLYTKSNVPATAHN